MSPLFLTPSRSQIEYDPIIFHRLCQTESALRVPHSFLQRDETKNPFGNSSPYNRYGT